MEIAPPRHFQAVPRGWLELSKLAHAWRCRQLDPSLFPLHLGLTSSAAEFHFNYESSLAISDENNAQLKTLGLYLFSFFICLFLSVFLYVLLSVCLSFFLSVFYVCILAFFLFFLSFFLFRSLLSFSHSVFFLVFFSLSLLVFLVFISNFLCHINSLGAKSFLVIVQKMHGRRSPYIWRRFLRSPPLGKKETFPLKKVF